MLSHIDKNTAGNTLGFLQGGGEMGALIREYNWDAHPLSKPEYWPQSLKINIKLILNSGFPMFIWWSKELYQFNNDPYLPALGKKHPESLGAKAKIIWREIWKDLEGMVNNIFENNESTFAENLLLYLERKGFAEETYWTFSYSPVYDDAGEVNGVFCACYETTKSVLDQRRLKSLRDISEAMSRVQTVEEACQKSCDVLVENTKDIPFSIIYLINEDGTEARLTGQAGNSGYGVTPASINLNSELDTYYPLSKIIHNKKGVSFDYSQHNHELQKVEHSLNRQAVALPIFSSGQDKLIGFLIAGLNVNLEYDADYQGFHELMSNQIASTIDVVQAKEEVARQREYLVELFQQAPVAFTILSGPDYVIDLANPNMCELWGKPLDFVLGKKVREAFPEVVAQGIIELLDQVRLTGVPYINNEFPLELEHNGKKQTTYFNFVYHPMYNAAGEVIGIIAVATGVNEQVQARHKIEAMNRELLTINADLDNFVYSASHDLKAPISNIEGLMHSLVRYLPQETLESDRIQKLIGLMRHSVERFKKAVSDLTQVTKIQRESNEDVKVIDLTKVLDEVLPDFESMIAESGAIIETKFDENAVIRFSAKNIRSIIYNLVSNAIKYRSPERRPHIQIATEAGPEYITLTVEDNGLGMNLANESKIFSMFKRLHDHVEGSGVGLYIVKKIVENAGGRIEVESQVGKGSKFTVYFKK
jgi:signal transduction histidine kinase